VVGARDRRHRHPAARLRAADGRAHRAPGALTGRHRARRSRRLTTAPALVLLLAAAVGWLAWRGLAARSQLTAARADLTQARNALLDHRNDAAQAAIARAGARTARAAHLTGDPVFRLAGHVPWLGRSVYVAREVALTADTVARGLLPKALTIAMQLDPQQLRKADGTVDVPVLQQQAPLLDALAAQARTLDRKTDDLPRGQVVGPVSRGRDDIAGQLDKLSAALIGAARAVDLSPPLLGWDRPRRFFVLVQQTSESRGTGGLPGGFAVLEADKGKLTVSAEGTDADLRNGPIPVPAGVPSDYVDLYRNNGAFSSWQNVNLSPDLPSVARVVAARWKAQSRQTIDGVIALDAIALADILRGSGPVDIGGGKQIAPEVLPDYLAIGQYRGFKAFDPQVARKEKLTTVARAATKRVTSGGGSSADLVRGLIDAVRSGHLRMASDDPKLTSDLRRAGIDGALPSTSAPLAYPVVFNSSGGKLDYFLDRTVTYTAGACTARTRRSTITVDLTNNAPATGLPPYLQILLNRSTKTLSTTGAVTLSVYATKGAEFASATLDGEPISLAPALPGGPFLSTGTEKGRPLWYLFLDLARTRTRRLVLQLDEPTSKGTAEIPEQPLARPLRSRADVRVC
jgi:hypothetical protein